MLLSLALVFAVVLGCCEYACWCCRWYDVGVVMRYTVVQLAVVCIVVLVYVVICVVVCVMIRSTV